MLSKNKLTGMHLKDVGYIVLTLTTQLKLIQKQKLGQKQKQQLVLKKQEKKNQLLKKQKKK